MTLYINLLIFYRFFEKLIIFILIFELNFNHL